LDQQSARQAFILSACLLSDGTEESYVSSQVAGVLAYQPVGEFANQPALNKRVFFTVVDN